MISYIGRRLLQAIPVLFLSSVAVFLFILGGLFGGGIGRRWLYQAIDLIGAAPATAIKNAAPVITTALAVIFLGDQVELAQWIAVGAIVVGLALVHAVQSGGVEDARSHAWLTIQSGVRRGGSSSTTFKRSW